MLTETQEIYDHLMEQEDEEMYRRLTRKKWGMDSRSKLYQNWENRNKQTRRPTHMRLREELRRLRNKRALDKIETEELEELLLEREMTDQFGFPRFLTTEEMIDLERKFGRQLVVPLRRRRSEKKATKPHLTNAAA